MKNISLSFELLVHSFRWNRPTDAVESFGYGESKAYRLTLNGQRSVNEFLMKGRDARALLEIKERTARGDHAYVDAVFAIWSGNFLARYAKCTLGVDRMRALILVIWLDRQALISRIEEEGAH